MPTFQSPSPESLEASIAAFGSALVAFSGGVDSSVVALAAHRALGAKALAVTAESESTTPEDIALTESIARHFGFAHEVIRYSELAIPNYAANPANRCFYCKNELYTRLTALAGDRGFAFVLDGTNLDDGGDYRPGLKAVAAHGVRSPLRECGFTKAMVRQLAAHWGLPNHDRPAAPCLSSRIPYGDAITRDKLNQVAAAERALRALGLRELRCRHHGTVARLEVPPQDFSTILAHRERIETELKKIGFQWVTLDLGGFRSGGLNAVLKGHSQDTD